MAIYISNPSIAMNTPSSVISDKNSKVFEITIINIANAIESRTIIIIIEMIF